MAEAQQEQPCGDRLDERPHKFDPHDVGEVLQRLSAHGHQQEVVRTPVAVDEHGALGVEATGARSVGTLAFKLGRCRRWASSQPPMTPTAAGLVGLVSCFMEHCYRGER